MEPEDSMSDTQGLYNNLYSAQATFNKPIYQRLTDHMN